MRVLLLALALAVGPVAHAQSASTEIICWEIGGGLGANYGGFKCEATNTSTSLPATPARGADWYSPPVKCWTYLRTISRDDRKGLTRSLKKAYRAQWACFKGVNFLYKVPKTS